MKTLALEDVTYCYRRGWLPGAVGEPVLSSFSWSVPPGRTVLLGPNGAGKTTLLGLAATALTPLHGQVVFGGLSGAVRRDRQRLRRCVGWMPQHTRAIPGLTGREQVAYSGWLKGMSRSDAWAGALDALRAVDLRDQRDRLVSQLSGGQQRRIALAQALVHRAEILLLDEPTAGLDPAQRARFRELLLQAGDDRPVVVSTHQVDDLNELFNTVTVLDRGVVRFEGTVEAFLGHGPVGDPRRAEAAYESLVAAEQ